MSTNSEAFAAAASRTGTRGRRRTLLIKRGLQIRYGVISLMLFGMAAALVWSEFYQGLRTVTGQGLLAPAAVETFQALGRLLFVKVLIALGLVWSLSIVLSHYIAGPIYRVEESLRLLKAGDLLHRVTLREKDELKSLAAAYNDAIESLRGRVEADKDVLRDVIGRLETLALTETSEDTAKKLQAAANKLKDISAGFLT